jgi:isochorismate pyruvate lyase
MSEFKRFSSGAPWEDQVGYSRVLIAGEHVFVSGTAPIGADGKTHGVGDPYEQAKRCFEIIEDSLIKAEVPLAKVVRTRMFVTDISKWESFGRAHKEFFSENPPTTSMIEVSRLIDPNMMIEVEVEAFLG